MTKAKIVVLAIAAIAAFNAAVLSQTYAVPHEVPIKRLVARTFPEYKGGAKFPHLLAEGFYPIGWSRDGKFAYYYEPVDEACGCYYAGLIIQDLRTDQIVWRFKYSQDDTYDDKGNMTGPGDIRRLWAKNRKLFSQKLAENGIIASRFMMAGKTFARGGSSFTARSEKKMGKNVDGYEDRVNLYNVSVTSAKLGSKKVFTSEDRTKEDYWFMLDADLIGVLKSPYENRVTIVAIEVMRGWEGPPHTANINIVGADLRSGFSGGSSAQTVVK